MSKKIQQQIQQKPRIQVPAPVIYQKEQIGQVFINKQDKLREFELKRQTFEDQQEEFREITGTLKYNLDIYNNSSLNEKEKMELLLQDLEKQLTEIFLNNGIINDDENKTVQKKSDQQLLEINDGKQQNNDSLQYIKKSYTDTYDFYEEIIEFKDILPQTYTSYSWGLLKTCGSSLSYQGDIRNQKMWKNLIKKQSKINKQTMFTGIIFDPPWKGTALKLDYPVMNNQSWMDAIPIDQLQKCGYLFIWVTNSQRFECLKYFIDHNYKIVDSIIWVKVKKDWTVKQCIGYYFHHGMEECMVGQKQQNLKLLKKLHKRQQDVNVISALTREASRKPDRLYEMIENLLPNGYFLEIFGRKYNERQKWITVGNESIYFLQQTKEVKMNLKDEFRKVKERKM